MKPYTSVARTVFGTEGTQLELAAYEIYTAAKLGFKPDDPALATELSSRFSLDVLLRAVAKVQGGLRYFDGRWLLYFPDGGTHAVN